MKRIADPIISVAPSDDVIPFLLDENNVKTCYRCFITSTSYIHQTQKITLVCNILTFNYSTIYHQVRGNNELCTVTFTIKISVLDRMETD